MPLVVYDTDTP